MAGAYVFHTHNCVLLRDGAILGSLLDIHQVRQRTVVARFAYYITLYRRVEQVHSSVLLKNTQMLLHIESRVHPQKLHPHAGIDVQPFKANCVQNRLLPQHFDHCLLYDAFCILCLAPHRLVL